MDIYELRAKRLSAAIEKSGLSYVELEKITGVSKSSIQRYASGKTKKIPIESLEKIAHAIGADTKYLMGWEDIAPYKAGQHEEPPPPNAEYMFDKAKKILPDENSSRSEAFEDLDKLSEYDLLLLKKIVKAMAEVRAECMTENPHGNK